eukprot:833590-Rhodomonas_salina.1
MLLGVGEALAATFSLNTHLVGSYGPLCEVRYWHSVCQWLSYAMSRTAMVLRRRRTHHSHVWY